METIIFISSNDYAAWGGSEYLWCLTAQRFIKNGFSCEASVTYCEVLPKEIGILRSLGAKIHQRRTFGLRAMHQRLNRILPKKYQFREVTTHHDIFASSTIKLAVISQGGNFDGIFWMRECVKRNIPFVTITQSANETCWPTDEWSNWLQEYFSKAVCNYFVSKSNLELTQKQIGQKLENAKIVFNPFNVPMDYNPTFPSEKDTGFYSLANVARHDIHAKGQDLFLQVLSDKRWKERNLRVNLYGMGMHTQLLSRLISYYGVRDMVYMKGYTKPTQIWAENQALLLTSRYEGLPIALIEAMLCSRPPIITAVSGNSEVVIDNRNTFLAQAAIPESVNEAMERAWQKRAFWHEIGRQAREDISLLVPRDPIQFFYDELISYL